MGQSRNDIDNRAWGTGCMVTAVLTFSSALAADLGMIWFADHLRVNYLLGAVLALLGLCICAECRIEPSGQEHDG